MATKQVAFPDRSFPKTAWPHLTWPFGTLVVIPYLEVFNGMVRMDGLLPVDVVMTKTIAYKTEMSKVVNLIAFRELKEMP